MRSLVYWKLIICIFHKATVLEITFINLATYKFLFTVLTTWWWRSMFLKLFQKIDYILLWFEFRPYLKQHLFRFYLAFFFPSFFPMRCKVRLQPWNFKSIIHVEKKRSKLSFCSWWMSNFAHQRSISNWIWFFEYKIQNFKCRGSYQEVVIIITWTWK